MTDGHSLPRWVVWGMAAAVMTLGLASCSAEGAPEPVTGVGTKAVEVSVAVDSYAARPKGVPRLKGKASIASTPPVGGAPTHRPAQASRTLAGQALPTNQWWSSALTGPWTQPMWAHPLAVRVLAAGVQVSSSAPTASAASVITPFIPAITAGGPMTRVEVTGFGAFHVRLRARPIAGGSVDVTLVQGSPVLWLDFRGRPPRLRLAAGASSVGAGAGVLRVRVGAERWDVLGPSGGRWERSGTRAVLRGASPHARVAVARVPDGADQVAWEGAARDAAAVPVTATTSKLTYDRSAGVVTQTLRAEPGPASGRVWALLPHQVAGLVRHGATNVKGSYADARGQLRLVRAGQVQVRVPMPGMLPGVPSVHLPASTRRAVMSDLEADLSAAPGAATSGSYFGAKEMQRLGLVAEVAGRIGGVGQARAALRRLRANLVDWLAYSGSTDDRYFAYDPAWGGLIPVPAEFGSNDYNDHHLQYGYLVYAAAVMAEADPAFGRDYGSLVDLIVSDFAGGASTSGLPPFRVFNAYLGHSAASGFAPFADGNNQESSSEAVHAWEATVKWALVRRDEKLASAAAARYALEAATARRYWLGEVGSRPQGYAHTIAGIVWDAKVDYATWFDSKPESIQGIQLIPLTFGSLYRDDPAAAAARATALGKAVGGDPRIWGDLFTADLALADPSAAAARLSPGLPREPSTSAGLLRYWVAVLDILGPPRLDVVAGAPQGLAFGRDGHITLVAVNPADAGAKVTFRKRGRLVGTVRVGASSARSLSARSLTR
jgi:endo-1,3(4)-beta-glucanase